MKTQITLRLEFFEHLCHQADQLGVTPEAMLEDWLRENPAAPQKVQLTTDREFFIAGIVCETDRVIIEIEMPDGMGVAEGGVAQLTPPHLSNSQCVATAYSEWNLKVNQQERRKKYKLPVQAAYNQPFPLY